MATMTNNEYENLILDAIKRDDAQFFENNQNQFENWAMKKIDFNGFSIPCIGVAISLGSEKVFNKLLTISHYKVEDLSTKDVIETAIETYYEAATKPYLKIENIEKCITILKTLIQKGANPYFNADVKEENLLYYISQLEHVAEARSRDLFETILDTCFLVPLVAMFYLLQTVKDKQFFIDKIKLQYGSLDLASMSGSLLITAIIHEDWVIAKLLIQHGARVNFCGLGQSSPLKIVEDKITQLNSTNKKLLSNLNEFKNYLISRQASAFLNPYFNSKLRQFIDLKELSKQNKSWTELSMDALKKAALNESEPCIHYMNSADSNTSMGFSCSENFIDLCKSFLQYQSEPCEHSFNERVRKILNKHYEVHITAETLSPSLKKYFSEDYRASTYRQLAIDLFQKLDEEKRNELKSKKPAGCMSIFHIISFSGDDKFLGKLQLTFQYTPTEITTELKKLSQDLILSPTFNSALNELTSYLNKPEQHKTLEVM